MLNINIQIFGGRGAGNVTKKGAEMRSISNKLPGKNEFTLKTDLPELKGTEKQIKWAESIRKSILEDMGHYTIQRTSDGRHSDLYSIAKNGKQAIIDDIKSDSLINAINNPTLKAEKIERIVDSYNDLAKRISRYNEIASHTDASWWIDNRPNQLKNSFNSKLKKYIDG